MPAEHTTTTTTPHRTTVAPTRTTGPARPTSSGARGTTTARGNSRSITASITASTTTLTPTPTISPVPEAGGMSGAAIGGMAAGGAVLVAIIGLLCYKRRKRSAVGDSTAIGAAAKKKDAEAMAELGGAYTGPNKDISGPMALAPQNGVDSAPAHRPEAQFREQQQFRPGMRDELFAQPGSALHNTMSKSPASPGGASPTRPPAPPMGAQRSAPQPRNLTQGNLTPTPVSHVAATTTTTGKNGDADPQRAMGSPTAKKNAVGSPRSSYSSDGGESAYLTLEQAQQAHNHKMMGHKESISSVDMLLERSGNGQYQNQGQNSPYGYNSNNNNNNNNLAPPARSPMPPMSPDPYAESAYSDYPDDRSMTPNGYRPPPSGGSPYGGYQQQQQQPYYGQQQQGGNGYNNKQPPSPQRDSDYNQGPYGRF
ncbi:hypothetical protein BG015_000137 [Linnemannia schmuckeri]|uniref:Uncharacterized protein n=1 Tax=Linnemannia schmuckeri TaxID=64567 RepID=A0A9P5RRL4_9FUNG|nr:hypothetical protein BG015_000137 [Linnemannia schmuckeri]